MADKRNATASWSGYLHQGKVGIMLALLQIKDLLTEEDSYPASEIFAKGKILGISKRTLENSKQELGIKSIRVGTGWHWKLP